MGRGKFKGKPTGRRQFSTPEEMSKLSTAMHMIFDFDWGGVVCIRAGKKLHYDPCFFGYFVCELPINFLFLDFLVALM